MSDEKREWTAAQTAECMAEANRYLDAAMALLGAAETMEQLRAERDTLLARIGRIQGEAADVGKALRDMTAERDHLKRREQSIIAACERVADGGQYRADIVSAIQTIRRQRDAWARLAQARGGAMQAFDSDSPACTAARKALEALGVDVSAPIGQGASK